MSFINITGQRFGRFFVLKKLNKHIGKSRWAVFLCQCDCGNKKEVYGQVLREGKVISCGCFMRENNGRLKRTHGMSKTSIYSRWTSMMQRCFNKNNPKYYMYGARGITVCERWRVFENFFNDMGHPLKKLSIDRINNNGNYEPGNCRWATIKQQQNNTRRNKCIKK